MPKADPSKVHPAMAEEAMRQASERQGVYTEYIRLFYQSTGRLGPNCDAKDLMAWMNENHPGYWDKRGQNDGEESQSKKRA